MNKPQGRAPRFLRHDRMHESCGFYNRQGRLKGFRRHLCAMRTITLCFHKANRTYVHYVHRRGVRRAFCGVIVCMKATAFIIAKAV